MNVVVNGENIEVGFVEVVIDLNTLTRQFTIINTEDDPTIFIGDTVEIYSDNDVLRIKADVEYVAEKSEREFAYAGRNDSKYIVDCYADRTIQFSEGQQVQALYEEVAGSFGLKVIGSAKMPKDSIKTILIGEKFGKSFIEIAKNSGQVLTSDENGNIIIEDEPENGTESFVFGENIRKRNYKNDTTEEYDKYVIVSQSNYLIKQEQSVNIQGEYGSGDFVKVLVSSECLTEQECEDLAEYEYWKDRRKSFEYTIEVDSDTEVDVNTICMVTDNDLEINEMMRIKKIVETMSISENGTEDKIIITFERKQCNV